MDILHRRNSVGKFPTTGQVRENPGEIKSIFKVSINQCHSSLEVLMGVRLSVPEEDVLDLNLSTDSNNQNPHTS